MMIYALTFMHTPYVWAGNNIHTGLDCSGYVLEVLKGVGFKLPDMTAQKIYQHFEYNQCQTSNPQRGNLLFFGESVDRISHIAIAFNETLMLESGGAGRGATKEDSLKSGAGVRMRAINNRRDLIACLNIGEEYE